MTSVLEMVGVVKRFGSVTALSGLDFSVEAGEVHGFLGPNGAGKSTTIRLLLGMLRAHTGSIRVLGLTLAAAAPGAAALAAVGYSGWRRRDLAA
jgi:polyether ionophore transport system ATP-binding protein